MVLDPRRNLAATAAGILGIALFVAIEAFEPTNWLNAFRLLFGAAALAALVAGSWPSRRVRFSLLLVAAPTMLLVAIFALWTVGFLMLPIFLVSGVGLLVEYAREGRE
ncbi:MAG TPA: hypothetical protein VJ850_02000 [Candidatus Limnocylindrales bacterium]|nr:hypothetical protein [Candidatus Limnocylindrales bacterium]